jgi:hypothetical protein
MFSFGFDGDNSRPIGESHVKLCTKMDYTYVYKFSMNVFYVSNFKCSDGLYQIYTHIFNNNYFLLLQILNTGLERMFDVTS